MKGQSDRTKVVVRHLPPTITESAFTEQIDGSFGRRYNWMSFRPGKASQKHPCFARAYMDFKRAEDVIEFAEFFGGHVFVNEKGAQFKAEVEYAPSQRVPSQCPKKDGREGTIGKDPEYLEFLEVLSKPVENLPSAEIQLERREAERAGAVKDAPVVTPLMDFIRQKRAAKGGIRRSLPNGKPTRKPTGSLSGGPSSASIRRGSDKRKGSTMYVLRDTGKTTTVKDRSAYVLAPKRDDQHLTNKSVVSSSASKTEQSEDESGMPGSSDTVKKKIILLKGKERELPYVSGGMSSRQSATSVKSSAGSSYLKENHRREMSGKIIRSILQNKDAHQNQSSVPHSEQQTVISGLDKDKRPPRPQNVQLLPKDTSGFPDGKGVSDFHSEKQEKRTRNKDRPDRGVWAPLRRSDGLHASDDSLSSSTSLQSAQLHPDGSEGIRAESKMDTSNAKTGDVKTIGAGRSGYSSLENGSYKHSGRRGAVHNVRDSDAYSPVSEGKHFRRGGSGHGSHEKQVWVQKSSAGS